MAIRSGDGDGSRWRASRCRATQGHGSPGRGKVRRGLRGEGFGVQGTALEGLRNPGVRAGAWKVGNVVFNDDIVIYRVLAAKQHPARRFLMDLQEELERELRQQEILIVEREVEVL